MTDPHPGDYTEHPMQYVSLERPDGEGFILHGMNHRKARELAAAMAQPEQAAVPVRSAEVQEAIEENLHTPPRQDRNNSHDNNRGANSPYPFGTHADA
jgi:hypothetical protein